MPKMIKKDVINGPFAKLHPLILNFGKLISQTPMFGRLVISRFSIETD